MVKYIVLIFLFVPFNVIYGQVDEEKNTHTEYEKLIENANTDADYLDLLDQIQNNNINKININYCDISELQKLPYITFSQALSIIKHRMKYGLFHSVYELQAVNELGMDFIRLIIPFITIENSATQDFKNILNYVSKSDNSIVIQTHHKTPLTNNYTISDTAKIYSSLYLGSPLQHIVRYRKSYKDKLTFGVTMEKDAGEKFQFNNQVKGFDYYSFHFFIKNFGKIKSLALGDYQASFGQGLTFGSGINMGKTPMVLNVKRVTNGLRPYRSINENLFLRGGGITYKFRSLTLTHFYSNKHSDGTFITDSINLGENYYTTIINSGYHRTEKELASKNSFNTIHIGSNILFSKPFYSIGFTVVKTQFSIPINRKNELYNLFDFSGKSLVNSGLNYNIYRWNLNLFGEISTNDFTKNTSMIHGLLASISNKIDVSIIYRNYAKNYAVFNSTSFGENITPNNEKGVYTGLQYKINKQLRFTSYFDFVKFPWLKYRKDAPSTLTDFLIESEYIYKKSTKLYIRFTNTLSEKNSSIISSITHTLLQHNRSHYRIHVDFPISNKINGRTRLEYSNYKIENYSSNDAILFYQDLHFKHLIKKVSFTIRMSYYTGTSYDARIYAFENDIQLTFTSKGYSNSGTRYYILAKYNLAKKWSLWAKYAYSKDIEVSGNLKPLHELKIQLLGSF